MIQYGKNDEIYVHLYDMGIDGVMFSRTSRGIAVIVDRVVRGYVSADELRMVLGDRVGSR